MKKANIGDKVFCFHILQWKYLSYLMLKPSTGRISERSIKQDNENRRQLVRRTLIAVSICTSLLVMCLPGLAGLLLSAGMYPRGITFLFPWLFGLFGIAGLIRSWRNLQTKSALGLRIDVVLLAFGIIGAMIFVTILLFGRLAIGNLERTDLIWLFILAVPFPLIPIGLASVEIYKSIIAMRSKRLEEVAKIRNFCVLLLLGSLAVVATRVVSQEAIMMWYGRDLVPTAYRAADQLAQGKPYCVIGFGGVNTFEEMDKRALLLSAIQKRLGLYTNSGKDPHFGIALNEGVYWWSFRQRAFLPLPSLPGRSLASVELCDALKP